MLFWQYNVYQIDQIWANLYFYVTEASAAQQAGLRTALVAREGNEDLTEEHFQNFLVIESFGELFGEDEEDFKRLQTEDNGELNEDDDDDEDDEEDELGEEEEEPEDEDDGEDDEDAWK